ncbi:hypothetical protein [Shewanella sp. SM95]|uniref:hypothetical protein n=1 Tax=Shewanella sp. SM95 TaxID=2912812 RepID=UPI0021DA358C|nr:hypothetical protein [Shewanella sp. SM95]MCU7998115.1 hypothetical protein [Shewanella sp. SM95]
MPVKSNMKGLEKLKNNLKKLHGERQAGLNETMTPEFLNSCSSFSSLEELFTASGFVVESQDDFKAIPDDEWDEFIVSNTTFDSWSSMQKAALDKYAKSIITSTLKL